MMFGNKNKLSEDYSVWDLKSPDIAYQTIVKKAPLTEVYGHKSFVIQIPILWIIWILNLWWQL